MDALFLLIILAGGIYFLFRILMDCRKIDREFEAGKLALLARYDQASKLADMETDARIKRFLAEIEKEKADGNSKG